MPQTPDIALDEAEPVDREVWTFKARHVASPQATIDAKRQVRDEHGIPFKNLSATTLHKESTPDEAYRIIAVMEKA